METGLMKEFLPK